MSDSASPQLEDGFTRIANELLDAILSFPFSARQMKVVMAIVRKTYGYNKKRDDISASQVGAACGVARNHVTSTLNELALMRVIHKAPGMHGMLLEINKNYLQWTSPESGQVSKNGTSPESGQGANKNKELRGSPESGLVPNRDAASPESGQVDSPESGHTKDNLPKDNQQKTKHNVCEKINSIFMEAWAAYPKREGGNPRASALKAWNARVRAGESPEVMLAGVRRYAAFCQAQGNVGTRFVKQASTFFGPDRHFAEPWGAAGQGNVAGASPAAAAGEIDWWVRAGFEKHWEASLAGVTEGNAHLWRRGRPVRAIQGVYVEPWPDGEVPA